MAQPPAYTITTDFSQDESNSVSGRSTVVTAALDSELANISSFITAMRTNIALVQADDGTIKDDAVDLPTLASDVINYITTQGNGWFASDTGGVNAIVATLNPAPTALTNGMFVVSDIKLTNTSATVTMNVNGLGAKTVVTDGAGTAPSVGALTIGTFYGFQYDASADKFQVVFSGDSLSHSASATASASAAASSATDADTAKLAAEAALDAFSDQYLGAFTFAALPSVDGDGDPLTDGDLAYDTTNNVLRVYDLATTSWLQTVPSASDQTNINTVSGMSANIGTVAGISSAISNVSSISSSVTNLSGISSSVTNLSGISGAVSGVSAISSDVSAVNSNSANVTTVAGGMTNINLTATNISQVNNFAEVYRIDSSDPSLSLTEGDLVFRTDSNVMRVYNGSAWQNVAPTATSMAFGTLVVAGQSNVAADSTSDSLNLAGGGGVTLTTDASTDTVTITSSVGATNGFAIAMAVAL